MAASRLSRPGWRILGGLSLAGLVIWGLPRLLDGSEFFRVRRLEIRGLEHLQASAVAGALPLDSVASVFDDLAPLRTAAESIPGLEQVRIGRRLPGTIVVTVREVPPVALVMRNRGLRMVGPHGRVLPFDPSFSAPDLPILGGEPDSVVTRLLARIRESDPTFFGRVEMAWRTGPDVVLSVGRRRYLFQPDSPAEVIQAVMLVEQDLTQRGRRWAELDARFSGQVVVRWEGA
ncbi:MAG: FtsQ-type POTRA domain-containing protein [Gemmatimonadota bacterium]|nr:FtsQ-type POTRA domain-containing protein [Gemmatimonadota bacterium]MDH4347842.1 FtsQ-type POTRA domain-containing protein [Gemmatimonadota bacterium]